MKKYLPITFKTKMDCGDALVCDVSFSFVIFPYGVSDEVWCFIVLIPDLRHNLYVCPIDKRGKFH